MKTLELIFERKDRKEQKAEIINYIGVPTEFTADISNAATPDGGTGDDKHVSSLGHASAFISELAGELNGLIQE